MANKKKTTNTTKKSNSSTKKKTTTTKKVSSNTNKIPKVVEEEKIKEDTNTTSLSVLEADDLNDFIDEDLGIKKDKTVKKKRHIITNFVLLIVLMVSLVFFVYSVINKDTSIMGIISSLILTLFAILYSVIGITYHRKSKVTILISGLLLLTYICIGMFSNNTPVKSFSSVELVF